MAERPFGSRSQHARRTHRGVKGQQPRFVSLRTCLLAFPAAPRLCHGGGARLSEASPPPSLQPTRAESTEQRTSDRPALARPLCLPTLRSAPQGHRARQQALAQRRAPLREPVVATTPNHACQSFSMSAREALYLSRSAALRIGERGVGIASSKATTLREPAESA